MKMNRSGAIAVLLLVTVPLVALAHGASALPDPGLTPDHPLYFLKTWKEQIQLFFTFDAEQKAEQYLHLAEVRLAEYQKMIEKALRPAQGESAGQTQAKYEQIAERTLQKYENQLNRALEKAEELKAKSEEKADEIKTKIEEATSKHIQVLQENLAKAPEAAKRGLEQAIEVSEKGIEKVGNTLKASGSQAIQEKAAEAIKRVEDLIRQHNYSVPPDVHATSSSFLKSFMGVIIHPASAQIKPEGSDGGQLPPNEVNPYVKPYREEVAPEPQEKAPPTSGGGQLPSGETQEFKKDMPVIQERKSPQVGGSGQVPLPPVILEHLRAAKKAYSEGDFETALREANLAETMLLIDIYTGISNSYKTDLQNLHNRASEFGSLREYPNLLSALNIADNYFAQAERALERLTEHFTEKGDTIEHPKSDPFMIRLREAQDKAYPAIQAGWRVYESIIN